jgi:hypothetical protein
MRLLHGHAEGRNLGADLGVSKPPDRIHSAQEIHTKRGERRNIPIGRELQDVLQSFPLALDQQGNRVPFVFTRRGEVDALTAMKITGHQTMAVSAVTTPSMSLTYQRHRNVWTFTST